MRRPIPIALMMSVVLSFAITAQALTLTFTAIPDQDTARLQQRFDKIAAYLSKRLDTPVRYVPVKSYAATVEMFKDNQVQLAWFGGLSGVKARQAVPGSKSPTCACCRTWA